MYTSALLFALSGYLTQVAIVAPPSSWQSDYSSAWEKCVRDKKPLAIVVGAGMGGWQSVSKDGELDKEAKQLLEKHYVCVYIDTTTESGKKMAVALDVPSGPGLIIGDRSGTNQAFHHKGTLTGEQLTTTLTRFSNGSEVAKSTESAPGSASAPSNYPSVFSGGSYCPSCSGGRR